MRKLGFSVILLVLSVVVFNCKYSEDTVDYDIRGSWTFNVKDFDSTEILIFNGTKESGNVEYSNMNKYVTFAYQVDGDKVSLLFVKVHADSHTKSFSGKFESENLITGTFVSTEDDGPSNGTFIMTR